MKHALEEFGWDPWFAERFTAFAEQGLRPARVAVEHRTQYELYGESGPLVAVLAGKLRYSAINHGERPAVGDWVAAAVRPEGEATIHGIIPRRTSFLRRAAGKHPVPQVAAANIDVVFLVTSCNADFNPRRMERYLTAAYESGARPVIVLSKADLAPDRAAFLAPARVVAAQAPVILTSVATGEGIEELRGMLAGSRTGALLGSSGVGKSTLINALLGEDRIDTGPTRESDDRGRHTTTRRELVKVPGGGLLIDTPGMRELQIHEGDEGIVAAFDDVLALAAECGFADCRHSAEPGCAVLAAVADGTLPVERLESYRKLSGELDHQRRPRFKKKRS